MMIIVSWLLIAATAPLFLGMFKWGLIPLVLVRQRIRKTYPEGLGPLSENWGGGIEVRPEGDDLGKYLAMLTQNFEEMTWLQGKVFCMTKVEAEEVFYMIEALDASFMMEHWASLQMMGPEARKKNEKLEEVVRGKLTIALIPLNNLLKRFPKSRMKQLSTAA